MDCVVFISEYFHKTYGMTTPKCLFRPATYFEFYMHIDNDGVLNKILKQPTICSYQIKCQVPFSMRGAPGVLLPNYESSI